MNIRSVLEKMIAARASDLHLKAGTPPVVRVDGVLYTLDEPAPTSQELREVYQQMLSEEQRAHFATHHEIDFAFGVSGLARFRANIFMQRGTPALALRHVPVEVPSLEDLGLPPVVRDLAFSPRGLVLVTGRTGSGKSTTLAAMIDKINNEDKGHIVTIEDPVEYLHGHKSCIVNQRELFADTHSFSNALRSVLRQDPDVVLIGEMRDLETIEAALRIAETGHLTFGTLHTNSAAQTINRIIDVFPAHQQSQIRAQLSFVLEGILCQSLLPKASGKGRCLAMEILVPNSAIRNLVREDKIHQIYSMMQTGQAQFGMQTFNQSLASLYFKKQITLTTALSHSSNPDELQEMINRGAGLINQPTVASQAAVRSAARK